MDARLVGCAKSRDAVDQRAQKQTSVRSLRKLDCAAAAICARGRSFIAPLHTIYELTITLFDRDFPALDDFRPEGGLRMQAGDKFLPGLQRGN